MNDYNEVMVDIETLDTTETAIVYQIGLVVFQNEQLLYNKEFNLDIQDQIDSGRTFSASTMKFHLKNAEGIANSLFHVERSELSYVKSCFKNVADGFKPKYWWSKGDFDYKLLEDLLGKESVPWPWYSKMELRTLVRECSNIDPNIKEYKASHTALKDCLIQLTQLNKCREVISGSVGKDSKEGNQQISSEADTE